MFIFEMFTFAMLLIARPWSAIGTDSPMAILRYVRQLRVIRRIAMESEPQESIASMLVTHFQTKRYLRYSSTCSSTSCV